MTKKWYEFSIEADGKHIGSHKREATEAEMKQILNDLLRIWENAGYKNVQVRAKG